MRPIEDRDLPAFIELVFSASLGMTSLPKSEEKLAEKIWLSKQSFSKASGFPDNDLYFFVLEDLASQKIVGTSAIWTKKGQNRKDMFYRIENKETASPWPEVPKEMKILRVVAPKEDATEIGSLYLSPIMRHHHLGPLLSLTRFLFMAAFPKRFFNEVYGELRGVINKNESSPFWEGFGRHFCQLPFYELMERLDIDRSCAESLLPPFPIPLLLLPQYVQDAAGAINASSFPAFCMLEAEGFTLTNDIDLFDGGPKISAQLPSINTVQTSKKYIIESIKDEQVSGENFLISNERLDFRACYGRLVVTEKNKVILEAEQAEALLVKQGDLVRIIPVAH